MNKSKLAFIFSLFIILTLNLISCKESSSFENIEYVPFKASEKGRWGLVAPNGKVLVEDEFTYAPTIATEGRFWAPNSEGFYELYTTDKTPKQFDGEFRYVSLFHNGLAFATPRDKGISIVNKKGEVVSTIDKIDNFKIKSLFNIAEGYAVAQVDTLYGLINNKGEWVIKPKAQTVYQVNEGTVVVSDYNFNKQSYLPDSIRKQMKDIPEGFVRVYNAKDGKEISSISSKKYIETGNQVSNNLIAVKTSFGNNNFGWGIINMKGEVVVKPAEKYKYIPEINNNCFVYMDEEDKYGLASVDNKHKIKAKYDYMQFASDNIIIAMKLNDDEEPEYTLLDLDGNPISRKQYIQGTCFMGRGRKYAFVSNEKHNYKIINKKGEKIENCPSIYKIGENNGSPVLMTDHVNYGELIKGINFSSQSLDSLSLTSSVKNVLDRQARYYNHSDKSHNSADYTNTNEISIYRDVDGVPFIEVIHFPSNIAKKTYRTERVIDYVDYYWGYYWYHDKTVQTGTTFNAVSPSYFELTFDNSGVFRGKLRQLYKSLTAYFDKMGSVVDSNNSATLYKLNSGKKAIVFLEPNSVTCLWGDVPASKTSVYQYFGNKEDLSFTDFFDNEEEGDI